MDEIASRRPDGCPFDAYGAEPEMLETLTCQNCPLVAMLCEYKGAVVLERFTDRIFKIETVSDP